jgi:hypothetical protein
MNNSDGKSTKRKVTLSFYNNQISYLLRNRNFILHTDDKNLMYLDAGNATKVYKWKLLLQEYNIEVSIQRRR